VGEKTNRAAMGARIKLTVENGGKRRFILNAVKRWSIAANFLRSRSCRKIEEAICDQRRRIAQIPLHLS